MKTTSRRTPALLSLLIPLLWMQAGITRAQSHDCLIEPYQRIEIRSPITALIKAMHVDRGHVVQKGQTLIDLDAGIEAAAAASARYRSQMQGELRSAEGRLKFAQSKLERYEELSKQKYVSQHEREEAAAEAQVAEASLTEARDNRELALIESRRLSEVVEQRRLRSPVNAIVTDRSQHPGELAQAGEGGKPILKLAQIHPLRVELVLTVARYGSIKPGATAVVELEPPLKGRYTATVKVIDRVVDAASGTFRVMMELPNPDGKITAGVKCKVAFQP